VEVRNVEVMPKKSVVDEILKAQAEVVGKKQDVFIRLTEIKQELHIKRRIRKVEIFKKSEDKDRA